MKIRDGFVSNSSSTSFCVIGTESSRVVREIWLADGFSLEEEKMYSYFPYGYQRGKHFDFYGSYYPGVVGVRAVDALENMTISKAREWFVLMVKSIYGIDVHPSEVGLIYGERGND